MNKIKLSIIILIALIGGAVFMWIGRQPEVINDPIPIPQAYRTTEPTSYPSVSPRPSVSSLQESASKLTEVNLLVPFTPQAPHANWELPYQEFCEEASVFMAASYIYGWDIPNADFADQKMLEIKTFEENYFGYYKDTTAEETAVILREFYNIEKVKVVYHPTVEDIKKALNEKKLVLVPAAGQQLGNPYFTQPGPLYHMLVIKGYTKEGNFITNDPGTRRGADFIYSPEVIMNTMHDWNNGDVLNGQKVIIIVG